MRRFFVTAFAATVRVGVFFSPFVVPVAGGADALRRDAAFACTGLPAAFWGTPEPLLFPAAVATFLAGTLREERFVVLLVPLDRCVLPAFATVGDALAFAVVDDFDWGRTFFRVDDFPAAVLAILLICSALYLIKAQLYLRAFVNISKSKSKYNRDFVIFANLYS